MDRDDDSAGEHVQQEEQHEAPQVHGHEQLDVQLAKP